MGRHAGFLTASSSLLRSNGSDGPHLIFIPEFSFNIEELLNDIDPSILIVGRLAAYLYFSN